MESLAEAVQGGWVVVDSPIWAPQEPLRTLDHPPFRDSQTRAGSIAFNRLWLAYVTLLPELLDFILFGEAIWVAPLFWVLKWRCFLLVFLYDQENETSKKGTPPV